MIASLVLRLIRLLPKDKRPGALRAALSGAMEGMSSSEKLEFLLRLDNRIYHLTGQATASFSVSGHAKHDMTNYPAFFIGRVRPGERVLDIGSGTGHLAAAIARQTGASVVGIEIEPTLHEMAQTHFQTPNLDFRLGDATQMPSGERFDVLVLSNVLEHLKDRPALLQRLVVQFSPSRLLIRVPCFERDWRVPLKQALGIDWRLDPTHETEYTLESFRDEMRQACLTIIHQESRWGEIWAEACP